MSPLNFSLAKAILPTTLTLVLLNLFFFNAVLTSASEHSVPNTKVEEISHCYDIATKKERMVKNMILKKLGLLEPPTDSFPHDIDLEHSGIMSLQTSLKERYYLDVEYFLLFPRSVEKSSNMLTAEFHSDQLPKIKIEDVTNARFYFYQTTFTSELTYHSVIPEEEQDESEIQTISTAASTKGWKDINIAIRVSKWKRESNQVYKVTIECDSRSTKPELCNPIPLSTDRSFYPYLAIRINNMYSNETNYVDIDKENDSQQCNKKSIFVDMDVLDYSNWIFSPNHYRDAYCSGRCEKVVEKRDNEMPKSCKPSKTYPLPFIYWQNNFIVARNLPVVEECGCAK